MSIEDSRLTKTVAYARAHGAKLAAELAFNFVLPFAIYSAANGRFGAAPALMAASAPPILWSVATFIRERKVDAISPWCWSALEALKGIEPVHAIAAKYQVHPVQVSQWKKELLERLPEVFARKAPPGVAEAAERGSKALPENRPARGGTQLA